MLHQLLSRTFSCNWEKTWTNLVVMRQCGQDILSNSLGCRELLGAQRVPVVNHNDHMLCIRLNGSEVDVPGKSTLWNQWSKPELLSNCRSFQLLTKADTRCYKHCPFIFGYIVLKLGPTILWEQILFFCEAKDGEKAQHKLWNSLKIKAGLTGARLNWARRPKMEQGRKDRDVSDAPHFSFSVLVLNVFLRCKYEMQMQSNLWTQLTELG